MCKACNNALSIERRVQGEEVATTEERNDQNSTEQCCLFCAPLFVAALFFFPLAQHSFPIPISPSPFLAHLPRRPPHASPSSPIFDLLLAISAASTSTCALICFAISIYFPLKGNSWIHSVEGVDSRLLKHQSAERPSRHHHSCAHTLVVAHSYAAVSLPWGVGSCPGLLFSVATNRLRAHEC